MGHFSSTPAPAIFANELRSKYNFWLGREDSNLRMAESKSAALPLGYAPPNWLLRRDTAATRGRNIISGLTPINDCGASTAPGMPFRTAARAAMHQWCRL